MESQISQRPRVIRGVVGIVAVAGLAAAALSGCSSAGDASAGPLTLQVWGDTSFGKNQFKAYQESYPDLAKGQTLKVLSAGQGPADSVNKFRLELSSKKNIPDILQLNYDQVAEFAEAGVLSDVAPLSKDFMANVTDSAQTLMKYKGKTVAFPYEVKKKLWFYRKDLFQQAGIDVAKVKTQSEFVEAGQKLHAAFPKSYIWNLGPNPAPYDWQMITSGNGAKYSTQSPCEFVVGSDKGTAQAFEAIKALRESGGVQSSVDDWSPEWQAGLADGTIASTLNASWFPQFLAQYAPALKGKWGVTTWPEIGGANNGGGSEAGGSVFVIPQASQHKQAAADFLAHTLMDAKGAKAYSKTLGGAYWPNVKSLQTDPYFTNNDYFGTDLATAIEAADPYYKIFPYDPVATKEQTVLSNAMGAYLASGDKSAASALKTAQDQLTSQIGCAYK